MKKYSILILALVALQRGQAQKHSFPEIVDGREIRVYTTAENTDYRLSSTGILKFRTAEQPPETQPCIFADPTKTFQTITGIGGALTDAAAETYAKLSFDQQQNLMVAYFDPADGIGYSLVRTNMNSCDFSSDMYTYIADNDASLSTFSIAHDEQFRLPFIHKAFLMANNDLKLFISPWSPPAWMKDNHNMLQGGKLLPEYYQSWANYYVKYIKAYEKHGIPVWGLTVQNEPMAKQTWESCMYTAEEERDFIKNYLGPTLKKNGLGDKKLIAWDHNRDLMYQRASTILSDQKASKYVWGIGFHWYEKWHGDEIPDNVRRVQEAFPDKALLLTEACNFPFSRATFDQWQWGENYGAAMIRDFNNGATGWTDWNILLDETGGPNHLQNFCFAPVHADTRDNSLHFMNSYYYIGHFSKYIRPGAKRIAVSSSRAQLLSTGFINPDGSIVVIVMNATDTAFPFKLYVKDQAAETKSLPHSVMTLVF